MENVEKSGFRVRFCALLGDDLGKRAIDHLRSVGCYTHQYLVDEKPLMTDVIFFTLPQNVKGIKGVTSMVPHRYLDYIPSSIQFHLFLIAIQDKRRNFLRSISDAAESYERYFKKGCTGYPWGTFVYEGASDKHQIVVAWQQQLEKERHNFPSIVVLTSGLSCRPRQSKRPLRSSRERDHWGLGWYAY